jgi:putative ABC transport system permease protein
MENLRQDLKYALRVLAKDPIFAGVAVLTLALGIGANTAIFSVVNGVLLRPLPYKDADGIVVVWQNNIKSGVKRDKVSPANFIDWKDQNQVFEEMACAEPFGFDIVGQGEPERVKSWLVTPGFFRILGANALYGRTFIEEEEAAPAGERVAVISDGLWRRRFGSDPNLVGQKLLLSGQPYSIVGIMPPEFQFPSSRDVWALRAFTENEKQRRGSTNLTVVARLKPGISVQRAGDEMNEISSRLAQQYPQPNSDMGATVVALPEQLLGSVRPALMVLLGAVILVLLIACANVANLLLLRGTQRSKEFALRAALGASRVRILRQLLTESILLALLGGAGGILLALWGISVIHTLNPGNLPRMDEIAIHGRIIGFVFAVSVITALIFGLAPALQSSRLDLHGSLKEGGRAIAGANRNRLRNILVVSETAFALVLLIGTGLLIRSFSTLLKVDPGFVPDRVLALETHVWSKYRTPQERAAFFGQTIERISGLPGVQAAGAVSSLPFSETRIDIDSSFTIEGRPASTTNQQATAYQTTATPDYFKALGIPLLAGRFFTQFDDQTGPPVVLINDTMARRHWRDEDPIGKKITVRISGQPTTCEIVGVVGDVRYTGLDSDPRPEIFVPHTQNPYGSMMLVVRTTPDPLVLMPAVKSEVWAVNKDQAFSSTATMEQLISASLKERRFSLVLLAVFAAIALVLAGVGTYGLMSSSTNHRMHEMGIRIALGAQASDILKMIIGQGIVLALTGIAIGLVGAFVLTRFLKGFLFEVTPTDPTTFGGISVLLILVALLASYIPARRATRVDPVVALRAE